jgi:Lrp/AsnC family transcriptional regulator
MELTRTDRRLLAELQKDATRNQAELAELVGMSRTSLWRRVRDFENMGLIERRVTLLNPKLAGFTIEVLLLVSMTEHTDENRRSFERHVSLLPEVMECFSVSGDRDYLLQVVARDMDSYNNFLNARILRHAAVRSASSTFVLRRIKYTTELPIRGPGALGV